MLSKKRTQEDIENEITEAISNIIKNNNGQRDFSLLMNLDKELIDNSRFTAIETIAFDLLMKKAEDMFFLGTDIQNILYILQDMSTFPSASKKYYTNLWLTHKDIFRRCPKKIFSVLSVDSDLKTQFDELQYNIVRYENDVKKIYAVIQEASVIYKKRDDYDMGDFLEVDRRFKLLSGIMLSDIPADIIINSRKLLLSYALNGDLENALDNYDLCKKYIYEKYFMTINDRHKVPVTDILIAEAILYVNNYKRIDLSENINLFIEEYRNNPEMEEQFALLNKVYQYLGLIK